MNASRTVLVTTDGSARSHRVLPHAALLAEALDCPLALLDVIGGGEDAGLVEAELRATLSRLGIEGESVVEKVGKNEKVAGAILRVARAKDAALLALDSRGHGALRHVLHGSVALDLLKEADRLLLVSGPNVDPPASEAIPYRILIANDGSPAAEAVLRSLAPLLTAGRFEATLLRVHEHEPGGHDDAAAMAACHSELGEARQLLPPSLTVTPVVREIPRGAGVDTAIIEKALEVNAQAIALSTHGLSARKHVMMGSVATTMLGRSPLPLLLARSEV